MRLPWETLVNIIWMAIDELEEIRKILLKTK